MKQDLSIVMLVAMVLFVLLFWLNRGISTPQDCAEMCGPGRALRSGGGYYSADCECIGTTDGGAP